MNLKLLLNEVEDVKNSYNGLVRDMRQLQDEWDWDLAGGRWDWAETARELQRLESALGSYHQEPSQEPLTPPRESYWRSVKTVIDDDGNIDYALTREANKALF